MKGIVWGLTFEDAKFKLKKIEEAYQPYTDIINKRESKHSYELTFSNGDHWIACNGSECHRGRRCNISYIDARLNEEIVQCIIKPITVLGPFHAINYYYDFIDKEELLNEGWKISELSTNRGTR